MKKPQLSERDNFSWLLGALVFLLLSDAIFSQLQIDWGDALVNVALMITIFVAVWTVEENRGKWLQGKIIVSLLFAALMLSDLLIDSNVLEVYILTAMFLLLTTTLVLAWRQVMFVGQVDTNKVIGAICIYILLGLIWAFGYLVVEGIFPGSLNGLKHEIWQKNMEDVIYYSMVTLTTLGYGDITPEQPITRFLAYMEAVAGIFYTTVLVASLIGMQLAHHRTPVQGKEP